MGVFNGWRAKRSGGFGTLNCLYPQMFISGKTVYIRTSPPFFLGAVSTSIFSSFSISSIRVVSSKSYFPAVSQLNGFEKGRWMRRLLFLPPRLLGQRPAIKSHAGGGAIALHKREPGF